MLFRSKKFKNKDGSERVYAEIVESRRIGGSPRNVSLLNLGRVDTPDGKRRLESLTKCLVKNSDELRLLDLSSDLKAEWSKSYGPALIFRRVWEDLGISKVVKSQLSNFETEFDVSDSVFNMVLNRLVEPTSKHGLSQWQESIYGISEYESQHYYRAMD